MRPKAAALVAALTMLAASFPAAAQTGGGIAPGTRTIEVDGHGEVRAKPDTALLSVAIETHAVSAAECARLNAELAAKVSAALKARLGDKGKIQTGSYSLFPEYSERAVGGRPAIVGYRAENSITVETGDTNLPGPLIDTAIAAGANRINALNFTLKDDIKARAEAIAKAAKDAEAQANALAAALGVRLKRVLKASTVSQVRPVPVMGRMMAASVTRGAEPTPIEAGEVTIPATVSLVYEIE